MLALDSSFCVPLLSADLLKRIKFTRCISHRKEERIDKRILIMREEWSQSEVEKKERIERGVEDDTRPKTGHDEKGMRTVMKRGEYAVQ